MNSLDPEITVSTEFEVVEIAINGRSVVVGDHYGDPAGTILDKKKRWIASYGEGLQVYFIREPFHPYTRNEKEKKQWITWGTDTEKERFIESAKQVEDGIEVMVEGETKPRYFAIDYKEEKFAHQGASHNGGKPPRES